MLKLCIIGVGNAGDQVADLGGHYGKIPSIALNSSEKDLVNVCHIPHIVIGDEKGAGKNRGDAQVFMQENIEDLLTQDKFSTMVVESEVVVIVSSIDGGTGSGMVPVLTEILSKMYPKKRILVVQIYPRISESVGNQQNGIDYLKEIRAYLPNVTYMAYDNQRRTDRPVDEMMDEINLEIVEDLMVLRGDYQIATPYSSIDEKDMLRLIETPGRLMVIRLSGIKEKDLDEKSIEEQLIFNLKNSSVGVELERDRIVKRLGVISNLNPKIHKTFSAKLDLFKEFVGEPVEGFEHIYVNKEDGDPNGVFIILSGLSVPDDRIQKMLQRIEEVKAEISKKQGVSILDSISTDDIDALRENGLKSLKPQDVDMDDIFSRYLKK